MSTAIYPTAPPSSAVQSMAPSYVNPTQTQSAHAGPSSPPLTKRKLLPSAKRKRIDPTEDSSDHLNPTRKAREGPKKKKANRACFHCQKAHLTCDDSRPCQRCIKRGIANNCTEGHRKKAKYLLDEDELEQLKRSKSSTSASGNASEPPQVPPAPSLSTDAFSQNDSMITNSIDPTFAFGSEAASLEYSILSAILGNPSPAASEMSPPPQSQYASWSSDPIDFATSPQLGNYGSSYSDPPLSSMPSEPSMTTSSENIPYMTYGYPQQRAEDVELQYASQYTSPNTSSGTEQSSQQMRYPHEARTRSPPIDAYTPSKAVESTGLLSPAPSNASPTTTSPIPGAMADLPQSELQSIKDTVTKPYDYTEGYHFLMKHLPIRFDKDDILRIVRALAIFRPSLIALQMPLSRDDEVFVERCFQRTLVEMKKLISYSGTPTVIWRRTGEICLVAPEFCMLTEWPMEELVGRKKYIYELFENQSVVEYWENFATHAFENTTQSVYAHCVLLKPNGAPVPAAFCFSVRRDLFDLPSMVIGQWLPLL
ncbi:hypothetical protein M378DRAFT_10526 [Amanita muscaria Koide BX008]|uniref:Transcription activator of gluconeogenesis ERT1 n=1 Tax=Amanita muscaria (strain Koide BX008) TaxID=946122 RepID=A0A0C2X9F1_AMAMK|nr:hypothetical protein M378DRAFT_10526 [Amanita muscaria Koide BX008]